MNGFICSISIYEYQGWIFEYGYCGPWPLTKELEPCKRAGNKFYAVIAEFDKLSDDEKRKHRIGGGCEVI